MAGSILNSRRTRAIVLIRRPRETVRSIIEMGLVHGSVPWHRDFEQVARYYETRLAGLLRLTEALRGRVVFLEAEALLANTQDVLEQLGVFLELQSPLQTEPGCFAHGGGIAASAQVSRTAVSLPHPLAREAAQLVATLLVLNVTSLLIPRPKDHSLSRFAFNRRVVDARTVSVSVNDPSDSARAVCG
jgi:hypothetical protein